MNRTPSTPWAHRLTDLIFAWRWPLLGLAVVSAAIAWAPAQRVEFDRTVESMFAPGDPLLAPFHKLTRTFGGNEVVVVAYVAPDLLTPGGIERVRRLSDTLAAIPGVEKDSLLSLADSPFGKPQLFLEFFEGLAIGADHQTTAILLSLLPEKQARENGVNRHETIESIRAAAAAHDSSAVVVGEPVMVVDGFDYLEQDGKLLAWVTTSLLVLVIVICFRSLRWVLIPILVVEVTVLWTRATIVWVGFRLSIVSSMITAIITVIGIATVIHLIVSYRDMRAAGQEPRPALLSAFYLLLGPIFWACATDAAGFGSLYISDVIPVQSFAVMMTIGSFFTFFAVIFLVPGLALAGSGDQDPKRVWGEGRLVIGLRNLAQAIQAWPKLVGLLSLLIVGVSSIGYWGLEVETDFTKNFRQRTPIVAAYQFVEQRLGGAGAWDIVIPVPDKLNEKFLDQVRTLEQRLRDEVTVRDLNGQPQPALSKVVSITDALDAVEKADPTPGFVKRIAPSFQIAALQKMVPPFARAVYGEDPETPGSKYVRVMLRSREQQSTSTKTRLIEQVERIVREEFPNAEVTGYFVLMSHLIESLLGDQWTTFGLSAAGILLLLWIASGSFLQALVGLIPNVLPIFVVLGLAGLAGFKINMGTVMIAATSMGLAVDSSVHYLAALRHAALDGKPLFEAIEIVHQSVGRAMVLSNAALIVGFSALTLSHFIPTIYFGVLVSLSMIGGVIGNLVLLPLFLRLVARWIRFDGK